MKINQKKGYVLALTMTIMTVVIVLSSVALTLITTDSLNNKIKSKSIQNYTNIIQISEFYENLSLESFGQKCQSIGYEQTLFDESILRLKNKEIDVYISVVIDNGTEILTASNLDLTETYLKIRKQDGTVKILEIGV